MLSRRKEKKKKEKKKKRKKQTVFFLSRFLLTCFVPSKRVSERFRRHLVETT